MDTIPTKPRSRKAMLLIALVLFVSAEMSGLWFTQSRIFALRNAKAAAENGNIPGRLLIPAIAVDANVQQVGLEADGSMSVPKAWMDAGWYKLGTFPGDEGTAVIVGHLDTDHDNGGVFWNLNKLIPGERVYVLDKNGKAQAFIIRDKKYYDTNDAPLKAIFTSLKGRNLNLITCAGSWLSKNHTYSQRLVIFAELVQ